MTTERDPTTGDRLTFDALRGQNVARCEESFHPCDDWTPTDWACAAAGEMGETCNLIKKLRRGEDIPTWEIGNEIADVVIYLDLLAHRVGLDLGECVARKFNVVSDRVGSARKLHVPGDRLGAELSETHMVVMAGRIAALERLIVHAWIHSGYPKCGYLEMETDERRLFDEVIGEGITDEESDDRDERRRAAIEAAAPHAWTDADTADMRERVAKIVVGRREAAQSREPAAQSREPAPESLEVADVAREVLEMGEEQWARFDRDVDAAANQISFSNCMHPNWERAAEGGRLAKLVRSMGDTLRNHAPTLARAVLDLTARAEQMERYSRTVNGLLSKETQKWLDAEAARAAAIRERDEARADRDAAWESVGNLPDEHRAALQRAADAEAVVERVREACGHLMSSRDAAYILDILPPKKETPDE